MLDGFTFLQIVGCHMNRLSKILIGIVFLSLSWSSAFADMWDPHEMNPSHYPLTARQKIPLVSESTAKSLGILPFHVAEAGFVIQVRPELGRRGIEFRLNQNYRDCINMQIEELRRNFVRIVQNPRYNYPRHIADSGFGMSPEIVVGPATFSGHVGGLIINRPHPTVQDHLRAGSWPRIYLNSLFGYEKRLHIRVMAHADGSCEISDSWALITHLAMLSNCIQMHGSASCTPYTENEVNKPWPIEKPILGYPEN